MADLSGILAVAMRALHSAEHSKDCSDYNEVAPMVVMMVAKREKWWDERRVVLRVWK